MGLAVHGCITLAGLILATPTLFFSVKRYLVFARGYSVFNAILLFVSALLNLVWSYTVWGVAYYSMDYVTDFCPFFPITHHRIFYEWDGETGEILNGLKIYHVQLIWFLFAFVAWIISIHLYLLIRRKWTKATSNNQIQDICA